MPIDYERAKRNGPKLKAKLTRAEKARHTIEGYAKVKAACVAAVAEWEHWGAWPDNWSHWQRALDDAAVDHNRRFYLETPVSLVRLDSI